MVTLLDFEEIIEYQENPENEYQENPEMPPKQDMIDLEEDNEPLISDDELKGCWSRLVGKEEDTSLTFRQFCLAMDDLGFKWTIDEAKTIFKTMDTDKSKDISYGEFSMAVNHDLPMFEKFWAFLMHPPSNVEGEDEELEENVVMTIDQMIELLQSTTSDWRMRVKAMRQLKEHIENMSAEDFSDLMEDLCPAFQTQLGERRSVVIKEACVCLVDIDKAQSTMFSKWVPALFPALFQCVRMNVQIINKSGMMACANIVRNTAEDDDLNVLKACLLGLEEPHNIVREVCFTYICTIFEINDLANQSYLFWNLVFEALQKGVNDSDSKARTQCYNAIKCMKQKQEDKYKEFFATLETPEQKRVMRALGIKAKRKKLKRRKAKPKVKKIDTAKANTENAETFIALSPMTPRTKEDFAEKKAQKEAEEKFLKEREEAIQEAKWRASTPRNDNSAAKTETKEVLETIEEPPNAELTVPLKTKEHNRGYFYSNQHDSEEAVAEISWRKQTEDMEGEGIYSISGSPASPKIGDTYYFLNVLGYKQKAIVRDKDGDQLTVEWLPNDRRYSHTGIDVRSADEPSHVAQDQIESSTVSVIDEGTTHCACIIS